MKYCETINLCRNDMFVVVSIVDSDAEAAVQKTYGLSAFAAEKKGRFCGECHYTHCLSQE